MNIWLLLQAVHKLHLLITALLLPHFHLFIVMNLARHHIITSLGFMLGASPVLALGWAQYNKIMF